MTTNKILAFNRWDCPEIKVEDPGLKDYVNVNAVIVPRTGAKYAGKRFHKSKLFIVERLINKVMVPGRVGTKKHKVSSGLITGKAATAYNLVLKAFEIIEKKSGENPIAVFVKALENASAREEIITIEYGGARYPKPVECSPQRRIDRVLKFMTQGSYKASFNKKKSFSQALSEEILAAYNLSTTSLAISKKLEVERQADSSR